MKNIIRLLAVSVLVVASVAHAEMPTAKALNVLILAAIRGSIDDIIASKALVKSLINKEREGAGVLAKNEFIIADTSKATDADVVVRVADNDAMVYSTRKGNPNPYLTVADRELELGTARKVTGDLQARLEEVMALSTEDAVLDAHNADHFAAMKYILRNNNTETERIGGIAQEYVSRYGTESNVTLGYPSILKIADGRYLLVRTIRIKARSIDAAAVEEMIKEIKGTL